MSLMSDALEEKLAQGNISLKGQPIAKHDDGAVNRFLHNVLGGLEGMAGSGLKGAGTIWNASEDERIEAAAQELEDMGMLKEAETLRNNTPKGYSTDIGNTLIDTGKNLSRNATEIQRRYGSRPEYADMGLWEALTNPDYLTDSRGVWADMATGAGSSVPFILGSFIAPEVTIGSRALGIAGKYAPGLLGKGITNASKGAVGKTLDSVAGYALNPIGAPLDAFTNASEMYDELKEKGLSDNEIAQVIKSAAAEELPLDLVNQGIFGAVTHGKLFRPGKGAGRAKRVGANLAGIPVEMASEYFQESMQQRMTNKYTGKPTGTWYAPTQDEATAGRAGAMGSLLTSGAGAAHGIHRDWKVPQEVGGQSFSGNISGTEGIFDNNGNASATPSVTRTADLTPEEIALVTGAGNNQQGTSAPSRPTNKNRTSTPAPVQRHSGSGEGTTWIKQTDAVSLEGARPETLESLELLADWFHKRTGRPLVLTAGTNGNHPSNGSEHGHDAGWKLDINDWGSGAEGTILGENDGEKGSLADELIAYGQSLGLGMNWEGDHIDVSAAGEQWEGEKAGNFGGLKLDGSATAETAEGSGASNQRLADIAARVSELTGINPSYIYGQMMHESGGGTHDRALANNNFAGLHGGADGKSYANDEEFARDYADILMQDNYAGLAQAKSPDEFVRILKNGGYFTDDNVQGYIDSVSQYAGEFGSRTNTASNRSPMPEINVNEDTSDVQRLIEQFAQYERDTTSNDRARNFFDRLFDVNDNFQNTPENRQAVRDNYGKELEQFAKEIQSRQEAPVQTQRIQETQAPKGKKAEPPTKIAPVETNNLDKAQERPRGNEGPTAEINNRVTSRLADNQQTESTPVTTTNQLPVEGQSAGQALKAQAESAQPQEPIQSEQQETVPQATTPQPEQVKNNVQTQGTAENLPEIGTQTQGQPLQQEQKREGAGYASQYTTKSGKVMPAVTWDGRVPKEIYTARINLASKYGGKWNGRTKSIIFWDEAKRDNFLQAISGDVTPVEEAAGGAMPSAPTESAATTAIDESAQPEGEKKDSKPVVEAKKNFAKAISDFRKGKATYEKALEQINRTQDLVNRVSKDQEVKDRIAEEYNKALAQLNAARDEMFAQKEQRDKQREADSAKETETASDESSDEDYHGFFTGGREKNKDAIKERLGEKVNPFGDAKGFVSVKKLMESFAESDDSIDASRNGFRNYKVHNTAVNKAAYDYYLHLMKQKEQNTENTSQEAQERPQKNKEEGRTETPTPEEKSGSKESTGANSSVKAMYSDKSGSMRGGVKDGVITVWQKSGGLPKAEFSFTVTISEIDEGLKKHGNSNYIIHEIAKNRTWEATENWIENTKDPALKAKRKDNWENDTNLGKYSAGDSLSIDSAARVIKELYEKATGHAPESWYERSQRERKESPVIKKPEETVQDKSAQNQENVASEATSGEAKAKKQDSADTTSNDAVNQDMEDSIFGSIEDADREMFEALGITSEDAANEEISFSNEFGDTTDEEIEALKNELKKELSKLSVNPMFNPRVYSLGLQLGGKYIQKGYRTFKTWVEKMRSDLGEDIEPWAPAIWETLRTYPKGTKFEPKQAMAISRAIGARYERGTTDLKEIEKDITKGMSDSNKKTFAPVIEASYNGIKKFFDDREVKGNGEGSKAGKADSGRTAGESGHNQRSEEVSQRADDGEKGVSKRKGTDNVAHIRVEEAQAENGETASEAGSAGGLRPGVSGETGRQKDGTAGSGDVRDGREGGSGSESSSLGGKPGRTADRGRGTSGQGSASVSTINDGANDGKQDQGVGGTDRPEVGVIHNTENYHIEDMNALFGGTPKVRFARNREAIETFQELQAEKREPTQEEKDAMAAFTGWGSFGQQLFQGTYENPKPAKGWEKESEWLRDTLGKEEWESARDSIINAHYTSPIIVKSLWDMARNMGFKSGRVLEPSMGVGNFFGLMPKDMKGNSTLFGVEMDSVTGGMAKMLYPKANIQISPYQDVHVADGTYDFVIGNVPFGNVAPADRRYDKIKANLHDYFFLKGIDELRPGGIMMAITSKGTMDKKNRSVRIELAKKAELIDAYRFPTGAFGEYAGTDVVTDVLVFRKREQPIFDVANEEWIGTTEHETGEYDRNNQREYTYRVNNFFENHPEKVLGKMGVGRVNGRAPGLSVSMDEKNFQKQLDNMAANVTKGAYQEAHYDKNLQYVSNNEKDRIGTLQVVDNKLYVATGVDSKPIEAFNEWKLGSNVKNPDTIKARLDELKDLVKLRKAYAALEDAEKNDAPNTEKLRKNLKSIYDDHIKKYCCDKNGNPQTVKYKTHDENNKEVKRERPKLLEDTAGLKLFKKANEPNYFSLCALQRKDGKPAKILTERVTRSGHKDIKNPSIREALMIQRNQSMRIDVEAIAKASKKTVDEVLKELKDFLFKTPNGDYQVADQYLSGNVRRKLREAKAAYANGDKSMKNNIDALEKVMPEDIPYYNISVGFGGTWIDLDYYKQFIAEMVGTGNTDKISVTIDKNGAWLVKFEDKAMNATAGATVTYGTSDVKFDRLITHALNHTQPTITRKDASGHKYKDEEAIQTAVEQIGKIRETFADWVWKDEKRKIQLAHNYNEVMNNTAKPNYDGSFLDMAGMMLKRGDKEFNLRKHQVNAIYRGLVNGSGIYAHEVGTGKTYTMGGLALESRRFGIAKKPLILAHNANSQAVANEIQEMYPGAKILYINGDAKNVKRDLMRIKMDDWDLVVMPHSKTNKLTLKEETLDALSADIIAELEDDAIEAAKADGIDISKMDMDDPDEIVKIKSQTAKDLVLQRLKIKEQIRKYAYKASDEDAIPFEDLGIDMVIVDESHDYKKPPFSTKMTVKGLQKDVSGVSTQLFFLSQYVQGINNGKGIHLFTGTPITNTVTEIYHNMKYVMPNEMKEAGIYNFDAWFNTFANVTSNMEYTSTGEVENVDRLNAFVNVAELRRMVGQYMDIVFAEDMPEFKPRETASGKTLADKNLTEKERDYLVNGRDENAVGRPYIQTINEVIPMNDAQKNILSMFMDYAREWKGASKKRRKEIMIEQLPQTPLYTESSVHKAAMDARMYNPNVNVAGMDSKEARVVKNVAAVYNSDPRATQVVMMDQGKSDSTKQIPRSESGYPVGAKDSEGKYIREEVSTYNLQKGIVKGLIEQGIPEKEIAVVTGSTKPETKAQIADAVNRGEIRVVIGSTATLGTGVNMQTNLKAIHHIDAPWMPGDLEQRNGRILRQGNKWNTVLEYRYITEKLDGRRWQVLSTKKKFIKMFMKGDENLRILDGDAVDVSSEEGDGGNDFEETLSKATGDPRFLRKANLEEKVKKLEKSKAAFDAGIEEAKYRLQQLNSGGLSKLQENVRILEAMQDKYLQYKQSHKDSFEITIKGKKYIERPVADNAIADAFANGPIEKEFKIGEFAGLNLYGYKGRNTDFAGTYNNRIRITDGEKTIITFSSADSVGGITSKLNNVGKSIERENEKLEMAENDIKTLEKQIKETFPREAVLNARKKELEALEKDLQDNPVPPPQWLVEGAPVLSDVLVDGKQGVVENYRISPDESSFYVGVRIGDKLEYYPWQEVKDNQGIQMVTAPEGVEESPSYSKTGNPETVAEGQPRKDDGTEATKDRDFLKEHVIVGTVPKADSPKFSVNLSSSAKPSIIKNLLRKYSVAWHGTPHSFDQFTLDHIGSGEGAQAHGYGLYFAEDRSVSEQYRDYLSESRILLDGKPVPDVSTDEFLKLSNPEREAVLSIMEADGDMQKAIEKVEGIENNPYANGKRKAEAKEALKILRGGRISQNKGNLLRVEIPDEDVMLDEQKSFKEQPKKVQAAIRKILDDYLNQYHYKKDGEEYVIYRGKEEVGRYEIEDSIKQAVEENNEATQEDIENWFPGGLNNLNGRQIYRGVYKMAFGASDNGKSASKLLNKYGVKGIAYDGRQDGRCYVVFDDKAIKILDKLSADMSEMEAILATMRPVDNSKLNSQQKKIGQWAKELHTKVEWFTGDKRLHGFYDGDNVLHLNVNSEMSLPKVFWHETFHYMRGNNDGLYGELVEALQKVGAFSKANLDAYRKKIGRPDMSDELAAEEMLADEFEDVAKRAKYLKAISKENPDLMQRFVAFVKDLMNRFVELFHNPEGKLTTVQRDRFVEAFGKLAADLLDGNGRPLFKVSSRGKDIRLVNGNSLATVKLSLDNSETLTDNERRAIERIKDDMDYSEAREQFFHEENGVVAAVLSAFERVYKADNGKQTDQLITIGQQLKEARDYANEQRKAFDTRRNVANLERLLRDRGQLREGSYLEEDVQRVLDALGNEDDTPSKDVAEQLPGEYRRMYNKIDKYVDELKLSLNLGETHQKHSEQGAFSNGNNRQYSVNLNQSEGFFKSAMHKLGNKLGLTEEETDDIITKELDNSDGEIGFFEAYLASPSRIAKRVGKFTAFFQMGVRAMDKLTRLRTEYNNDLNEAMKDIKSDEDRDALFGVLWNGDAEGKEYTEEELRNDGVSDKVIKAYFSIRNIMDKAYEMIDDARRRPTIYSKRLGKTAIENLEKNPFIEIMKKGEPEPDGKRLVTYKEYKTWEREYGDVEKDAMDKMKADPAVQILDASKNSDGTFNVRVKESIPHMNKLGGYIPHFFHEYSVDVKDSKGKFVARISSGRTQKEARDKAREWLKNNSLAEGQKIYISPKVPSFGESEDESYAAIMGDRDFRQMIGKIAEANDMTLDEVDDMLAGSVRMKNRHRFFGNAMHRKGVEGYEEDMAWVLRHYVNSASRYVAMETEFKPKAISLFERYFGDFAKDWRDNPTADYIKDYIKDINGDPSTVEKRITALLNKNPVWRKLVVSNFGDRAALQLGNTVTNWTSYLCLGVFNTSSALLNLTQVMNSAAYIGDVSAVWKCIKRGFDHGYTEQDLRVLDETNVANDIGLDSGAGYDRRRSPSRLAGKAGELGMTLFKKSEAIIRRGTVLAAYDSAIKKGMTHAEAIKFAKDVNRKSNFSYGVEDAPNIFRRGSIISQLLLQFKKYPIKELEVMGDMLPYLSKETSAKQKAIFWGTYFLFAGLMGLFPGVDWLDELLGKLGMSPKDSVQRSIMEAAGDDPVLRHLAASAMYGGVGTALGIDFSNRVGMSDVIPSKSTDILGPSLSRPFAAGYDLLNGDPASALRDISSGAYNIYSAAVGENTGSRGRINSRYTTAYERMLRAFGFKSTDERVASDIQRISYNSRSRLTKEKQAAVDAYLADPSTKNAKKLRELGVKPETVKKERERKRLDRMGRVKAGMSKEELKKNRDMMKFAD